MIILKYILNKWDFSFKMVNSKYPFFGKLLQPEEISEGIEDDEESGGLQTN